MYEIDANGSRLTLALLKELASCSDDPAHLRILLSPSAFAQIEADKFDSAKIVDTGIEGWFIDYRTHHRGFGDKVDAQPYISTEVVIVDVNGDPQGKIKNLAVLDARTRLGRRGREVFRYLDRKFLRCGVFPGEAIQRPLRMPLLYSKHCIKADYLKIFKYDASQVRPIGSIPRNLFCRIWYALGVLLGRYDVLDKSF